MNDTRQIDGIDVFIEGDGAQSIVLIHGWPDTHRLWDASVQALLGRYRCVAFETGHWVMSQRPEPFNQAVLAWLGSAPNHSACET